MTAKVMSSVAILAGVPAAGKSTILHTSLDRKIPLFGADFNSIFLAFENYENPEDDRLKIEYAPDVLSGGYWLNNRHIRDYPDRALAHPHILIHLDLMTTLRINSKSLDAWSSVPDRRKFFLSRFSRVVDPILAGRQITAINTIVCPIQECSRRFVERRARYPEFNITTVGRIYEMSPPAISLFDDVRHAWEMYTADREISFLLRTEWQGTTFKITNIAPR